jgi:hypothetical protein
MGKNGKQRSKGKTKIPQKKTPVESENIPTEQKPIPKKLGQWFWEWNVVGSVSGILWGGGGFSFMTSAHPYFADFFFLMGGILLTIKFLTWDVPRKHQRKILIRTIASFIGLVITIGPIWGNHYINQDKTKEPALHTNPSTLRDLFKNDFPNFLKTQTDFTLKLDNSKVYRNVYYDFEGRNVFISFFIPLNKSSFDICKILSKIDWEGDIKKLGKEVYVKSANPGDSNHTSSTELVFSRRIYIYHEDFFSLQQLAILELDFQDHGLSVVFRGTDYLAIHMINNKQNKN